MFLNQHERVPERASRSGGAGSARAGGEAAGRWGRPWSPGPPDALLRAAQRLGLDHRGRELTAGTRRPGDALLLLRPPPGLHREPRVGEGGVRPHPLLEGAEVHSLRDPAWPAAGAWGGCFLHVPFSPPHKFPLWILEKPREKWSSAYTLNIKTSFLVLTTFSIAKVLQSGIYVQYFIFTLINQLLKIAIR